MEKLWRARAALGILLASVFITLSYELKSFINPEYSGYKWIQIMLSFIIAQYIAGFVTGLIMERRWGRRLILGSSWIEGYWIVTTIDSESEPRKLPKALSIISYRNTNYELRIETLRYTGISTYTSSSELAILRGFDNKMCNFFHMHDGVTQKTEGCATGRFSTVGTSTVPNTYEGEVVLFSDGHMRKQVGVKMSWAEWRRRTKGKKHDEWIRDLLRDDSHVLPVSAIDAPYRTLKRDRLFKRINSVIRTMTRRDGR